MPLNYKEEQRAVDAFKDKDINMFVSLIIQRVFKDKNIKSLQDCITILTKMSIDPYESKFINKKSRPFTEYQIREAINRSYEWFYDKIPDLNEQENLQK